MDLPNNMHGWGHAVAGASSLCFGGVFWMMSHFARKKARLLEAAKPVDTLSDLPSLAHLTPVLVSVVGRTGCKKPLVCETNGDQAVLKEVVEKQHVWRRREDGSMGKVEYEQRREKAETEWYLEDGSSVQLRVENGLSAVFPDHALQERQTYLADPASSLWKVVAGSDLWTGLKRDGVTKTEFYLPVGTAVTAVGELACSQVFSLDRQASSSSSRDFSPLYLRKSKSGVFFISRCSLSELHAALSSKSVTFKWLAVAFGSLGAYLIVSKLVSNLLAYLRQRQLQRRRQEAAEAQRKAAAAAAAENGETPPGTGDAGEGESVRPSAPPMDARQSSTCAVCLDQTVDSVFVPCGHMCCCFQCGRHCTQCPICRVRGNVIKVFAV